MHWDHEPGKVRSRCAIVLNSVAEVCVAKAVVANLASDLEREFPGIQGFSAQNLWRMRQFYVAYVGSEKLAPLVREIGWSHNLLILERCKDPLERDFYLRIGMGEESGVSKAIRLVKDLCDVELNRLKRRLLQAMKDGGEKENPARE